MLRHSLRRRKRPSYPKRAAVRKEPRRCQMRDGEMSKAINYKNRESAMIFETLNVQRESAVLFVEIAAPPMDLLGAELVRDLVSLIHSAEADDSIQVLVF